VFSDSEGRRAVSPPAALTTAVLALGGLAVTHAGPGVTALGPVRQRFFPRLSGLGRADHVALTFDDGPDPAWTPAFLEVLAKWQVRATFFMLGSMAAREPGLAAEVAGAGHEVAVHGWAHRYTVLRGPRAVADDLARARDAVAGATGAQPRFYRPPYGVLSTGALAAARRLGLTPVLWTCWGREWTAGATPRSVWATVAANLTAGATVLLHDSDCTSPPGSAAAALGALPLLLEECAIRSLVAGPLAEHGLVS
jgi:peptidoglycan-N-acetylglucosamine deacetylase